MFVSSFINDVDILDTSTSDVAIVIAGITLNGQEYQGVGTSRRNPLDSPDAQLGVMLATSRALHKLSKELQKATNRREAKNAEVDARKRRRAKEAITEGQKIHDEVQKMFIPKTRKTAKKASKTALKV